MTDKRKEMEDEEELDLEKEFGIQDSEIKDLLKMKEKGNLHVLRHKMKPIDEGISKIEDGLYDILFSVDEIIADFEEGKIFAKDASEALEHLFTIASFVQNLEVEFKKLEAMKNEI